MNRSVIVTLLTLAVSISLACDPTRFPKTRHAATQATQAVTETAAKARDEVRPVAHEIAQGGRRALERGRNVATRKYEELQPTIQAAKATATRVAHDIKVTATQKAEQIRSATTRAVEKIRQ